MIGRPALPGLPRWQYDYDWPPALPAVAPGPGRALHRAGRCSPMLNGTGQSAGAYLHTTTACVWGNPDCRCWARYRLDAGHTAVTLFVTTLQSHQEQAALQDCSHKCWQQQRVALQQVELPPRQALLARSCCCQLGRHTKPPHSLAGGIHGRLAPRCYTSL